MNIAWTVPTAVALLLASSLTDSKQLPQPPHLIAEPVAVSVADRMRVREQPVAADDTTLFSYVTDSVRVIQRLLPGTDVVAVNVYLLGGSRQLTAETQGIEAMLVTASKYGTRSFPDSILRAAWAMTGSKMVLDIGSDWTMLGFRGIRDQFDASWNIATERLTAPLLSVDALDLSRQRLVSVLKQTRASPDGEISIVSDSVVFAGHPYGLSPYGTEQSLASIDSAAIARYVSTQILRSRMLVVVAGAATRAMVEAAIRRTLTRVPVGSYVWTPPAPLAATRTTVTMVPRTAATNYVIGVFDGPPHTDGDFTAFRLATGLLGQLISEAVREKRGLSYAASASVSERALVTGQIYVSTSRPDTVLRLIKHQIDRMLNPDSMPAEISFGSDKNSLEYIFRRSTSAAQVEALAQAELMQGDYRLAMNVPRSQRTVSGGLMRTAVRKYIKDIRFVYAGDTMQVKRKSFAGF